MSPNDGEKLSEHKQSSLMILNRDDAVNRMGDDKTLFEMFLQWYLEGVSDQATKIARAIDEDEAQAVEAVAHSMKGGAATAGAERISDVARRLELVGRNGDLSEASRLRAELEREISILRDHLDHCLANDGQMSTGENK